MLRHDARENARRVLTRLRAFQIEEGLPPIDLRAKLREAARIRRFT